MVFIYCDQPCTNMKKCIRLLFAAPTSASPTSAYPSSAPATTTTLPQSPQSRPLVCHACVCLEVVGRREQLSLYRNYCLLG